VEAVFPPEICRIFSDDFRQVPAEKHGKLTGIYRKKSNKFPVGILLPLLSCRILRDPVAVIFNTGSFELSFNFHGYALKSL